MVGGTDVWRFDGDTGGLDEVTPDAPFIPPQGGVDNGFSGLIDNNELGKYLIATGTTTAANIKDGMPVGSQFTAINGGTGAFTITRNGIETINGGTQAELPNQYDAATFYKGSSTEWWAIGGNVVT